METPDPRIALSDRKVSVRAAAARDLALVGTWDDLPRLIEKGWADPSMAVRLHAAAAAADLVGRQRGAYGQSKLTAEEEAQVLRWAFGADPGASPSMLMLAAPLTGDEVLVRLGRVVRDPRSDVRLGVVTAIRRMVLSAVGDRARVSAALAAWLADERLPTDTRGELIRVIGEAGLTELREAALAARRVSGDVAMLADKALDRLDARLKMETWVGPWRSDGLDVFELAEAPRADELALVAPGVWYAGPKGKPLVLSAKGATIGGKPAHLVWATPLGSFEPSLALQFDGRTWWRPDPAWAAERLEALEASLRAWGPEAATAVSVWAATLPPAVGERIAALAAWLAGDLADARARLDVLLERKKPAVELWLWRARVHAAAGRTEAARMDAEAFLERAPKGHAGRKEAEKLGG